VGDEDEDEEDEIIDNKPKIDFMSSYIFFR
jgi:hypothetical protein